jgi:hypothetical protein
MSIFMKIPPVGAKLFRAGGRAEEQTDEETGRQTDLTKLTVSFRKFATAPKSRT